MTETDNAGMMFYVRYPQNIGGDNVKQNDTIENNYQHNLVFIFRVLYLDVINKYKCNPATKRQSINRASAGNAKTIL